MVASAFYIALEFIIVFAGDSNSGRLIASALIFFSLNSLVYVWIYKMCKRILINQINEAFNKWKSERNL